MATIKELDDEQLYDVIVELMAEAEERGMLYAACHTHEGVPMLESEVVTFEEDYDMCIPVVRLFVPEQVEAVRMGADSVV